MIASQFWLFGGPNGAGKSTLAKSPLFSNLPVPKPLNPDDVALGLLRQRGYDGFADAPSEVQRECSIQAANWVFAEVERAIQNHVTVGVESVLSTDKYRDLFQCLAESGGEANLIYVGNQAPEISINHVKIRTQKGGHDVPTDKIVKRWHRSLEHLPIFWRSATQAWIFDNSKTANDLRMVAHKNRGTTEFFADDEDVLVAALKSDS